MREIPEMAPPVRRAGEVPAGLAWWEWLAGGGASLIAGALLLTPGANFHYDWHNHQWMTGYFGEYLRAHGRLPEVLHAPAAIGMPQPVFYGFLLYPLLGGISALTGAALALRIGVGLALLGQFLAVYLAARGVARHRGVALVVATAATWSVHGLTNLYNRAALPEFFAVAALHSAVACGVLAVVGATPAGRSAAGWWAAGLAVLVAGAHPPTALMAAPLLAALALVAGWEWAGDSRKAAGGRHGLLFAAGLGVLALAPWLDANLRWRGELGVVGKYRDFSFSRDRVDAPWARFSPLPPDVFRADAGGPGETPHVEAPVHVLLLALAVWGWWRFRGGRSAPEESGAGRFWRRLVWVGALWFGGAVAVSLLPAVAAAVRILAPYVQFATRWVGPANAGLLAATLGVAGLIAERGGFGRRRETAVVVGALLLLGAVAVGLKLRHGAAVREPGGEPQFAVTGARTALVTAGRTDAAGDYATLRRPPQLAPAVAREAVRIALPVGAARVNFGQVGELIFRLPEDGWVVTNVVVFPWSRVTVDGRAVPEAARMAQDFRQALRLPAGVHRVAWSWEPDTRGRVLRALGLAAAGGLALGALGLTLRAGRWRGFSPTSGRGPPGRSAGG